jgi:hypothetical protein
MLLWGDLVGQSLMNRRKKRNKRKRLVSIMIGIWNRRQLMNSR